MNSRNWYIAKMVGLRFVVMFALAWWAAVVALAVINPYQQVSESMVVSEFARILFSGLQ